MEYIRPSSKGIGHISRSLLRGRLRGRATQPSIRIDFNFNISGIFIFNFILHWQLILVFLTTITSILRIKEVEISQFLHGRLPHNLTFYLLEWISVIGNGNFGFNVILGKIIFWN